MEQIGIRKADLADLERLQALGRQTFFETFAAQNTPENMAKYLAEGFSHSKLTAELTDPHSEFYFAAVGEEVIGYLKVNFGGAQTELKDVEALEIERIYVQQAYHGKRVGQILYEQAIAVARARKATYVWLGVWEENPRAIRFYKKNGFVEFGQHIFMLGEDAQTDIMMRLEL